MCLRVTRHMETIYIVIVLCLKNRHDNELYIICTVLFFKLNYTSKLWVFFNSLNQFMKLL